MKRNKIITSEKEVLLLLVKHQGNCSAIREIQYDHCIACPFGDNETKDCALQAVPHRKEAILDYYLDKYGKDEDLLETLI